jgi:LPXTG-motif cell wall-anchored protein
VRFHRIVGFFVAITAAVLMAPAAAHARPYPVEPPASEVSDGTVSDGGTVTFSGGGFLPYEKISINISYSGSNSSAASRQSPAGGFVLAAVQLPRRATLTVTADGNGYFSIEVPLTQVGSATLVATGLTSGVTVTANVEVLPPAENVDDEDGDDGALPTTGPSGGLLLIAVAGGAGAVLLGAASLWFARTRRRSTTV